MSIPGGSRHGRRDSLCASSLSLVVAVGFSGCVGDPVPPPTVPIVTPTPRRIPTPSPTPAEFPLPTATPRRTPFGATPTPTPTPTPGEAPSQATLSANLRLKKNRTTVPPSYALYTPAEMRALPNYGDTIDAAEWQSLLRLEELPGYIEGELIYFIAVDDGGTYGRPAGQGDWHIEVRERSSLTRAQTLSLVVVCEITPPVRDIHPAWDMDLLLRLARFHGTSEVNPEGARVRLYGWLMYDPPHAADVPSRRGTAWEIHPITKIEYFDRLQSQWVEVP